MNTSITPLSDNVLQTQRSINSLKTRPIIINSIVTQYIKCTNVTLKKAVVSHNSTTCSNSKVLLGKPKKVKRPSRPSVSEEKISNIMRRYINIAPKDATASYNVRNCANSKDLPKKSRAIKRRSQNPKFKKSLLNSKTSQSKDLKLIQLSRQRADEVIDSILAQTQDQKIKEESQQNMLLKANDELQIVGYSRVSHEINNTLPILQHPNDPTRSLLYQVEGSIDEIKVSRYGGLKLSTSQKKQILQQVKQWIRLNENDREVYQQKLEELFEVSIPIEIGPDRGRSVYAKRNIRRLEVVGPYAGILQRSEEEFRRSIRQKGSYNVLSYLFGTRSKHRIVDGFNTSNTMSLINTGQLDTNPMWSDNNLVIIQVGKNLNFYVAKRDIAQGEELLVDYGPNYNPRCFFKSETEG